MVGAPVHHSTALDRRFLAVGTGSSLAFDRRGGRDTRIIMSDDLILLKRHSLTTYYDSRCIILGYTSYMGAPNRCLYYIEFHKRMVHVCKCSQEPSVVSPMSIEFTKTSGGDRPPFTKNYSRRTTMKHELLKRNLLNMVKMITSMQCD